ncbi:MAG: maltose ABC transporter substrate-binding protein [Bacillota bacterium]|nr:maltose ABC transporter substrate-binding protein [Bacillota bacterium]
MKKHSKVLASALTVLLVTTALAGCGSSTTTTKTGSDSAKLPTGQTLQVATHFDQTELPKIQELADAWGKKTGNTVKIKLIPKDDMASVDTMVKSSDCPDVLFGIPHDNTGKYAVANMIAEVPAGTISAADYSSQDVLDSGKVNGKQYAIPLFAETYALFYNKDKVKDVPKTWDELLTVAKANGGLEFDAGNFYYGYSLIASNGGYIFKNNNGALDTKSLGLNNDGAVKGLQMISDLVSQNFISASTNGDIAKGDFINGKTAFYISGPWDVNSAKEKKLNFGVAALPTINGQTWKSFMGLQEAMVTKNAKNSALAWDFVKYMSQDDNLTSLGKVGNRISVKKNVKLDDVVLQGFADQIKNATPMPNIPEMNAVWKPAGDVLSKLLNKKVDAAGAAKEMQTNVESQIKQTVN